MSSNGEKKAERALKEWMDALDAVEDPIFIHDRELRILRCNLAYQKRTGLPFSAIIGQFYFKLFPKRDTPLPHCRLEYSTPDISPTEVEFRDNDILYRSRAYAITDEAGVYLYSVHILEDITERRERETFIKAVLDNLPVGIAVNSVKPTVSFTYMNDNFPRIYRTTREQLTSPDAFWEAVYEDPEFRQLIQKRVVDDFESGDMERMVWNDIPITRRGMETKYVTARNVPMPDQASTISMVWDVTERKRAEQHLTASRDLLQSIIENAPVRIFWKDKELRYLGCNTVFARDAGMTAPAEMIGKDDFQMKWRDQAELYQADDREVIDSGVPKIGFEESQTTPDGSMIWLRTSKVPLKDPDGNIIGILGIYDVITAQKQAEEKLQESESRFKAIFEKARDGILLADIKTKKLTAGNTKICNMLGYSPEELPSLDVTDIHPKKELPYVMEQFKKQAKGEIELAANLPIKRKNGTVFYADVNTFTFSSANREYIAGFFRDITERKEAEERLQNEKNFSQSLVRSLPDAFFLIDSRARLHRWNKKLEERFGLPPEKMKGINAMRFVHKEDRAHMLKKLAEVLATGTATAETRMLLTNGVRHYILNAARINISNQHFVVGTGIDITDRIVDREQLKLFRSLLDHSGDGVEVLDPETLRFLDTNETGCRNLGYSRKEMLNMSVYDIDPKLTPAMVKEIKNRVQNGDNITIESVHQRKDGSSFPVEISATIVELERPYLLSIVRDITERKKTEAALESEARRRQILMESSRDGIAIFNQKHEIVEANARFAEMLRYTPEELLKLHIWDFDANMNEKEIRKRFANLLNISTTIETRHRRKDGTFYEAEVSIGGTTVDGEPMTFTITRDISDRKEAAEALQRSNRSLKTLSEGNLALVRAQSEKELIQSVCDVIVNIGGYKMSAVYFTENDPGKRLTPQGWSGIEESDYADIHLSWDDNAFGQLPLSKAVRDGETQICMDIRSNLAFAPWKETVIARNYVANIALPLADGGKVFGALSIYSSEKDAFDQEEVKLLKEMANDLSYGIVTLRARIKHEQQAVLLRQSLEQSIQTIASTVEARDPYTAGHQRRVAELATAIAREMGLDEECIEGIHLAATIHDLGKIHIPAEILAKPGKLTDLEYKLIQTHPQDGYDILKDVAFPWPIAEIILQHHEKMDGSGYPNGLRGEQIRLEARIIMVADVVEAMSSHRPYRPSLGMEPALKEIQRGRGSAYDPDVVDACQKLFVEKRFAFSKT